MGRGKESLPIYGKNLQKSLPTDLNPMILKGGMEQYVFKLYKVYINDDPVLTLTYFTTMSNLVKLVFVLKVNPEFR